MHTHEKIEFILWFGKIYDIIEAISGDGEYLWLW